MALAAHGDSAAVPTAGYYKWMSFDIPASALSRALRVDIDTHGTERPVDWVELLSVLAARYGGQWGRYKNADLQKVAAELKKGAEPRSLTSNTKGYNYYRYIYLSVLSEYVGTFYRKNSEGVYVEHYGLKVFSPIAEGYYFTHSDDFGDARSYGYRRDHKGNDLVGSTGTPIVAVESGVVEQLGWNQYGGWRVGIRSFDRRRYYYYAHLRKDHPYVKTLSEGSVVAAGQVIGYLGSTGYSTRENVNGMQTPHLHFGVQIVFDEAQMANGNEVWIDLYAIVELLRKNTATVVRDPETGDFYRKYDFYDETLKANTP